MPTNPSAPIANPTWYSDIRHLFTQEDIDHMRSQGLDLSIYDVVKDNSSIIYGQVASGSMPPNNPWPSAWVETFLNWMTNDCPKGTNAPTVGGFRLLTEGVETKASRIRKDITTLSTDELALVKKAFAGMIAKDPTDPNGFFLQAGIHWLPGTGSPPRFFCQHHAPGYNPWHRAYLLGFENAMRSIPGCENVTLPYWDITTPLPDVLNQPPFDKYTLPQDIGGSYKKGYVTERFDDATIAANLIQYEVTDDINRALTKTDWEDFHGYFAGAPYNTIIAAHDGGHVSIGNTMADQNVAAFDPIFFFFHCNWDRLFWKWQKSMQATDLNGLLSTIDKAKDPLSYQIFTVPILEKLAPFSTDPLNLTTLSIINSVTSLDVDYEEPKTQPLVESVFQTKTLRSALASQKFEVKPNLVDVRVLGLNRLKIPGSFSVHLQKDGKTIASKAFFQPNEAEKCENCVENAVVHFDFELPLEEVTGGKLGVWVEPVDKSFVGDRFPNKLMGNPSVEVRLLLSNE
ncbi:tyrosinase family protein [Luteolibacter ambystomatis]|uniref:Tyrosinase family protein n=1 Tax=Luteolibacter ambystomatis TaxID=2824561 RepID=A0A975J169_9BACT|nr:tyrosinase family protein [Luteolibacter ambystomatis]QUE52084.1 tyrosinase family protein [Luteolibacter ambystomatis]